MRRTLAVLAALALLAGCSIAKDMPLAQTSAATFHQLFNADNFAAIYDASSDEMKHATSEADFVKFLTAVHGKLGDFKSGQQSGFNDNVTTGGHFVTMGYAAKFANGDAQESFVYKLDGDHAQLAGYNVNSNALIEN